MRRFGGAFVGSIMGIAVSNASSWGWGMTFPQVIFTCGLIPVTLVSPWLHLLRERYARDEFKRPDDNNKLNIAFDGDGGDVMDSISGDHDQQMNNNTDLSEKRLLSKLYAKYEDGNE